jgi:hypothetical protein
MAGICNTINKTSTETQETVGKHKNTKQYKEQPSNASAGALCISVPHTRIVQ